MYLWVLALHSVLRWLVLLFGLVAVGRALSGWAGARPWTPGDDRAGRLFGRTLDVQVLLGLILYALLSPITHAAFANMGAVMRDPTLRYFTIEHVFAMIIAIAFVNIGRVRVRKMATDVARHRAATIFYGLALLAILMGIPWPFMKVGRPLIPSL
jgi:hypothetical protein